MVVSPVLMGGLANTLFQICTSISYSLKHGCEYAIPVKIQNSHYKEQQVFYSKKINYIWEDIGKQNGTITTYYETQFHYKEIPKFNCDYLILVGYWQSHLYFNEYREQILELLDIPYEFKEGWCSIQVRRGDYLLLPNCHPVITNEYIERAQIGMMNLGVKKFQVVSDDIMWCKEKMCQFDECEYDFSEGRTDIEDLILASSCEHSICSNSAYGWFIYWLNQNKNKVGVFPQKGKWFGSSLPHDVSDLYFPEWVLI